MDPNGLLARCYKANGNVAQSAKGEFVGLNHRPFSSGICDCDSGDCCSPGRTIKPDQLSIEEKVT